MLKFQTADAREIELARVEEHAFEQTIGGLDRRRIAGTHLAVNLEQSIDRLADGVPLQGLRDDHAHVVASGKKTEKL